MFNIRIEALRVSNIRHSTMRPIESKKSDPKKGASDAALRRFYALENKFAKNPSLKAEYSNFLQEYESLGHMPKIQDNESVSEGFFLPHHAVIKQESLTTKIRVVFDGSAKSSNGMSLNDILMVGPTVQDDLFSIYIRFRFFPFALTADIEKMYRQTEVAPEDSCYQKIL